MKKFLLSAVLLLALSARAEAICTVGSMPFVFTPGTTAVSSQVNANFNQVISSVGATCAASGSNSDITSLNNLTTPLVPSSGGTSLFIGANSTGTNAIVVATTTPSNFTLTTGYRVAFIAGGTNTAAATINVNGTGVKNLFRKTQLGAVTTAGGEVINGNNYQVVYDGTEFVLDGETVYIGEFKDWSTLIAPPGYVIADGSAISRTNFAGLFAVLGTTYGVGDGSTTFNIPDTRGRNTPGLDNYGTAQGAANRLTSAATGCGTSFTTINVTCANASESHALLVAELAHHTHGGIPTSAEPIGGGASSAVGGAGGNTDNCASCTGTAHPIVNPNLGVVKIIRF